MPLRPNPGNQPPSTRGKRVRVVLADGWDSAKHEPAGWAADTTNWSRSLGENAVMEWELIG